MNQAEHARPATRPRPAPAPRSTGRPRPATAAGLIGVRPQHQRHDRDWLPRLPLDDVQLGFDGHVHLRRVVQHRPTRTALSSPSATTARATRSSTSPSGTTASPRNAGNDGRAGARRHEQHLRRGDRLDGPQRRQLAPLRRHPHRRHDSGVRRRRLDRVVDQRGRQQQHHHRRLRRLPEHRARGELGPDAATAPPTSNILAGTFDEFRISNTLRSRDWIVDRLQHDEVAFVDLHPERRGADHLRRRHQDRRRGLRRRQHRERRRLQRHVHRRDRLHLRGDDAQRLHDHLRRRPRRRQRSNATTAARSTATAAAAPAPSRAAITAAVSPSVCSSAAPSSATTRPSRVNQDEGGDGVGAHDAHATIPFLFSITDSSLMTVAQRRPGPQSPNGYDIIFRGHRRDHLRRTHRLPPSRTRLKSTTGRPGQLIAWVNIPGLNTQTNTLEHVVQDPLRQPGDLDQHRARYLRPGTRASRASGTSARIPPGRRRR